MREEVSWLIELAVRPGRLDSFRALMHEMVQSTRSESGALSYEWFVNDDGSAVHTADLMSLDPLGDSRSG
jgi:quinol monooxygenase YgiN